MTFNNNSVLYSFFLCQSMILDSCSYWFSEPCFENGLSGRLRPLSIFPMFRQEVYQAMCHKSNLGTLLDQLFLFQTLPLLIKYDNFRRLTADVICEQIYQWNIEIIFFSINIDVIHLLSDIHLSFHVISKRPPRTLKRNSQVLKFSTLNKVDHRPKDASHPGTQKLLTGCKAFFCLKPSLKRVLMSQKNVCHKRCRLSK